MVRGVFGCVRLGTGTKPKPHDNLRHAVPYQARDCSAVIGGILLAWGFPGGLGTGNYPSSTNLEYESYRVKSGSASTSRIM